ARYVDYILNIDTDEIPGVSNLWVEIDYAEFARGGPIKPCFFANTDTRKNAGELAKYWDELLPPFLGEKRAKTLRAPLDRLVAALPKGAHIKQIGTMSGRGELDIMRLVIRFPAWEMVPASLAAIGWRGDCAALDAAMQPWKETNGVAVDLDLGAEGVLPKIGIELFSHWRHPLLVDKFLSRLEHAGLCLPSKAGALRRFIRIRPDGDPFIQTLIAYFKLNYQDGQITGAKAYLQQTPYIHHHFFDAYEMPTRIDMEVKNATHTLSEETAMHCLRECAQKTIRRVRFLGDVAEYEPLSRLLGRCRESGILATVVFPAEKITPARMDELIGCGADAYIAQLPESGVPTEALLMLCRAGLGEKTAVRWTLTENNAEYLAKAVEGLEALGLRELILSGGTPGAALASRKLLEEIGRFIRARKSGGSDKEAEAENRAQKNMTLSVDTCFSPLRALLGGEDPAGNNNRGITRGCEAGRSFIALRADGSFSPCVHIDATETCDSIAAYWETSAALQTLRKRRGGDKGFCEGCSYALRCLPCPAQGDAFICEPR
ncbi:MAG: hypothetical protein IJS21_06310, partial [Deltaproteobacteria bacterium]|nr:hypothetical protein [Deltaproteobacteria bacterium]